MLNNDIPKTSQLISDTLMNMPEHVIGGIMRSANVPSANVPSDTAFETTKRVIKAWDQVLQKVDWLLFSDSILVSLELDQKAYPLI
jgi:hypothetical protein